MLNQWPSLVPLSFTKKAGNVTPWQMTCPENMSSKVQILILLYPLLTKSHSMDYGATQGDYGILGKNF